MHRPQAAQHADGFLDRPGDEVLDLAGRGVGEFGLDVSEGRRVGEEIDRQAAVAHAAKATTASEIMNTVTRRATRMR